MSKINWIDHFCDIGWVLGTFENVSFFHDFWTLLSIKMSSQADIRRHFWDHLKRKECFSMKLIRRMYHSFAWMSIFVTKICAQKQFYIQLRWKVRTHIFDPLAHSEKFLNIQGECFAPCEEVIMSIRICWRC